MTGSIRATLLPDRGVLSVAGPDRASFLQGLVTNDLQRLAPDQALYAGLLTPQGKLLYDFFLVEDGTRILIDVAAAHAADLARRLSLYKLRAAVDIADVGAEFKIAALWGPGAVESQGLSRAEGAAGRSKSGDYAFVDPRLAELGVRLLLGRDTSFTAQNRPEDYAAHRLSLGIADSMEIGRETCYPLEANFEALHGVDFKKGCYVGQELTARMKHKGGLRKRVLPVIGTEPLPPPGTTVTENSTELGTLIAAKGANGLALLRLDRLAEAGALSAGEIPLSVHWPSWLPR